MSHYSKFIKPKEGVVGTSDLEPVSQKHRWQPGLVIVIWSGGGWSCGTEPLTCGIWHSLQVGSVRTELNLGHTWSVSAENLRVGWWYWKNYILEGLFIIVKVYIAKKPNMLKYYTTIKNYVVKYLIRHDRIKFLKSRIFVFCKNN